MDTIHQLVKSYLKTYKSLTLGKLGELKLVAISAQIHPIIHSFQPPSVSVEFISQPLASNEVRFVQYIIFRKNVPEQEAEQIIEQYTANILESLTTFGKYDFSEVGVLKYDVKDGYSFETFPNTFYNPEVFGLEAFKVEPIAKPNEVTIVTEEDDKNTIKAEEEINVQIQDVPVEVSDKSVEVKEEKEVKKKIEQSVEKQITEEKESKIKFLKILYASLIIIIIGVAIWFLRDVYINSLIKQQHAELQEKEEKTTIAEETEPIEEISEEVFAEERPIEEEKIQDVEIINNKYFIIGGSFQSLETANKYIETLHQQGFNNAAIVDVTRGGLHMVAYSGYPDNQQAESELQRIKNEFNPNVWLYKK